MTSVKLIKFSLTLLATLLALVPVPTTSSGQSLGEIARRCRKEREARKQKGEVPVKVFTNDEVARMPPIASLKSSMQGPSPPETKPTPPSEANLSATREGSSAAPAGRVGSRGNSKEYWRARFKAVRAQLAQATEEQKLVEEELHLLQIQQARELNPNRSRELNGRIDAATVELEAKRAATEKARQAVEKLRKEFKESGAPQDWVEQEKTTDP